MSVTPAEYHITTATGLRAIIPQLLGFTPQDSIVVLGVTSPDNKVMVTLRYDLPDSPSHSMSAEIAGHAEAVLTSSGITAVVIAGYGPASLTGPVARAMHNTGLAIQMADDLPDGTPEPASAPGISVTGTPVLPDRASLAALVAPVGGSWARDMARATQAELREANDHPGGFLQLGLAVTANLISRYRDSSAIITYDEAATITVALRNLRVRDDAWARMYPEHKKAHARLLTDLTRLAAPGFVAPPASLLAFVAWQSGNGALANVALDRALADDPRYSMALLIRQVITAGAPLSLARLPLTPEEVAESYNEMETEKQHTS